MRYTELAAIAMLATSPAWAADGSRLPSKLCLHWEGLPSNIGSIISLRPSKAGAGRAKPASLAMQGIHFGSVALPLHGAAILDGSTLRFIFSNGIAFDEPAPGNPSLAYRSDGVGTWDLEAKAGTVTFQAHWLGTDVEYADTFVLGEADCAALAPSGAAVSNLTTGR